MKEINFYPGDKVKIRLASKEIKGTIIESEDPSIVILKLNSGYNIGISKENILAGKVLKRFKEEEKENEMPKEKKELKNIGMIITGGTIASKLNPKTGGVKHITKIEDFIKYHPKILDIVNIKKIEIPFMMASESMNSEQWIKIAESAKNLLNDPNIEGVIITHGTDFLHYTSAALSFFLKNLGKPIILTYSQRSIDRASSDANLNLQCAARMAISNCAEIMLVGHATINDDFCYAMPSCKVRKMHSSRRDAFKTINSKPIAKINANGKIEFLRKYKPRDNKKITIIDKKFNDKVALVKFYPGQDSSILDYYALKYKGIIIEASGLGHLPVSESKDKSWIPKLKKHIRNGLIVCITTQTINGRVDPYVYSNGRELLKTGVIFLEDMMPEVALIKLGFILGHHGWKTKLKEKMLENLNGELNKRLSIEKL